MPVRGSTRRGSLRPTRGTSRPNLGPKRKAEEDEAPPAKRPRRLSFTSSIPSPVSSPVDPGLVKGKSKLREGGRRVAPRVEENLVFKKFPEVKSRQSKGIMNPSNLCYRNASLQALFHTPAFYHFLSKVHADCPSLAEECVLCAGESALEYTILPIKWAKIGDIPDPLAVQELLYRYWNSTGMKYTDDRVNEVSRSLVGTFAAACKANLPATREDAREIEKDQQHDAYAFIDYLIREQIQPLTNQIMFNDIFDLGVSQTWTCEDCGEETPSEPPSNRLGLSVEFADLESGQDMIWYLNKSFFYSYQSIWCDSDVCRVSKATREAEDGPERLIERRISRLPEILVVQLARFKFPRDRKGKVTGVPTKVDRKVYYPEVLNLNNWRHTPLEDDAIYRLDGVVSHVGTTSKSGHYIASVRTLDGRYAVINDNVDIVVPELDPGTTTTFSAAMRNPKSSTTSASPYVLIYSKL